MASSSEIAVNVCHRKKHSKVEFKGIFPILNAEDEPYTVVLNGSCGIVSEEDVAGLKAVGSFGTEVAEDVLDRYMQIQEALLRGEDVPFRDMFFLLDSVRRSHRQQDDRMSSEGADPETPCDTPMDESKDSASSDTSADDLGLDEASPAEGGLSPDSADDAESDADLAATPGAAAAPVRRLVLQPEEVLFLSHALGCARVQEERGAELTGDALFARLSAGDRHLAARYAAYLALRARGWVVRDGLLSGADFVVYRRGPAFYHASLVATVQVVSAESRRSVPELSWRATSWLYLAGLCRAAEQAAKDVLLVRLLWPDGLRAADLTFLSRVAVQEVHVRRWTPARRPDGERPPS